MDKCTHESSIVISDCTGFSLLRCTWECKKDLIQLDLGNHTVAVYTADDLTLLRDEHKFMTDQINKLNTEMPCGHLARYAVNEQNGTQYCSLCVLAATQLTILNLVNED